jgi:hypothetical protein
MRIFYGIMSNTNHHINRLDDPDFRGAEAAMLRAAQAARDEARKAGLTIPIWENGAIVRKHPDELEETATTAKQVNR